MATVLKKYESSSKPGTYHEVRKGDDEVVYCTCWEWKKNKTCLHLLMYKKMYKKNITVGKTEFYEIDRVRNAIEYAVMEMKGV